MPHRSTIGAKRNAGLQASRGSVVVHWDDDDVHGNDQVRTLACPIIRNETEITAPYFEYISALSTSGLQFFDFRRPEVKPQCFLGALTYRRSVAEALNSAQLSRKPRSLAPFANTSLSEDLHFVERALGSCHRMLPVRSVPLAYTRHKGVTNTWRSGVFDARMDEGSDDPAPDFADASLASAFVAAEVDVVRRGACEPLARWAPKDIKYPLLYPNMPKRCCHGQKLPRPCAGGGLGACDPDDTFCGASKGICTSTCTCAGEKAHGRKTRRADGEEVVPTACGLLCCRYWHGYWKSHPEECSSRTVRPLKRHYCGPARGSPS
jgi:hypothetical protein